MQLYSLTRPRFLLQIAILSTVAITLYLTFDSATASEDDHRNETISTLSTESTITETRGRSSNDDPLHVLVTNSSSTTSPSPAPISNPPTTNSSHSRGKGVEGTPSSPSKTNNPRDDWVFTKPPSELKPCQKIFLFQFLPWWGFASEYLLFVRSKSLAETLGYTFLFDDTQWNYGQLSNYFSFPSQPSSSSSPSSTSSSLSSKLYELDCIPPKDWRDYRKAYPVYQGKNWKTDKKGHERKRLRYSRAFLNNLDGWTREEYFSSTTTTTTTKTPSTNGKETSLTPNQEEEFETKAKELEELRKSDRQHRQDRDRWILGPGENIPTVFNSVFEDHSRVVQEVWQLNEGLEHEVQELKRELGLNGRKWLQTLDGKEDASGGRGPIIGLHIRLGDKETEYLHDSQEMGITNEFGNLTTYLEAAHDAYRRLTSFDYPPLDEQRRNERFSPNARPILLLMTAEPGVAAKLGQDPLSQIFKIVQTPREPTVRDITTTTTNRRLQEALSKAVDRSDPIAYGGGGGQGEAIGRKGENLESKTDPMNQDLKKGYVQSTFNSKPLAERIEHTKTFVRDLALLTSEEMDALIVTGSSNIGRLAMLIGGLDAVNGPRDAQGRPLGGRIRSIDAHFYPTSYPSSVYSKVDDVQDLEHAAFVPDEQLHHRGKGKPAVKG